MGLRSLMSIPSLGVRQFSNSALACDSSENSDVVRALVHARTLTYRLSRTPEMSIRTEDRLGFRP